MPFCEIDNKEFQFEAYSTSIEMSDFSTRSYVSEDFSDSASLIKDNYTLWANISQSLLETNFNLTNFVSENITIENNETVKLSLSGNYIAEYSFTNDANGADPAGWTTGEPAGSTVEVSGKVESHNKVVKIDGFSGSGDIYMNQEFSTYYTNSDIEFYIYIDSARTFQNCKLSILLYDNYYSSGDPWIIYNVGPNIFFMPDGDIEYLSSSTSVWTDSGADWSYDTWMHIRITFDTNTDRFSVFLNCSKIIDNALFANNQPHGIKRISFRYGWVSSGRSGRFYIDAIDYSWADGYYINRNYNNTYYASGYYQSPVYDIGFPQYSEWYYETLKFYRVLATNTALTCEYRYSDDNQTWSSWSAGYTTNQTINENKSRYLQFRINLTSLGNYTYTPECGWVELDYKLCSYTIVDEYVDVGIIKSWADYSSMVSNVFVDVQAKCSDEELKIAVLGDANNKSITVINNTGSTTFYTGSQEFVVFELSDYGIAYIENITCTGSPGQYFSSIVLHQNWNFESVSTIGMHMGLVLNADNTFSCRFANTTTFSVFDTTAYFEEHNNPVGTIPFELMHQLHFNVSFTTGDMMNVATDGCNFFLEFVFRNGTFVYDMIYYWNYTKATPGTNKTGAYGGNIYFLFDMQENTEYNIIRNISADIYNVFGVTLDESFITNQDMWSCGITVPNLQLNYVSFYENRSSYDIAINGTYGSQVLSTTGYANTLNFSATSSNLAFNYACTYTITYSGEIDWSWPTFVFTYRQLSNPTTFINLSFQELPPWWRTYYPDNLKYYLVTELNHTDVDAFVTSETAGVILSSTFEKYIDTVTLPVNMTFNFLLIIEMKESPPAGTTPAVTKPLHETVMQYFLIGIGILVGGLVAIKVYPSLTGGGTKVIVADTKQLRKAEKEISKLETALDKERERRRKLEQDKRDLMRKRRRDIAEAKTEFSKKLDEVRQSIVTQKDKIIEKKDSIIHNVTVKLKQKEKQISQIKKEVQAYPVRVAAELGKEYNSLQKFFQTQVISPTETALKKAVEGVAKVPAKGRVIGEKVGNRIEEITKNLKNKVKKFEKSS